VTGSTTNRRRGCRRQAWLGLMLAGLPIVLFVPTHLLLSWWRSGMIEDTMKGEGTPMSHHENT
jgi:hypothetical protein